MNAQWYYMLGDKKLGPVTAGQLKQLAQTGQLQPTDHVWKEGMASWLPAEKVKGLFPPASEPPTISLETTASDNQGIQDVVTLRRSGSLGLLVQNLAKRTRVFSANCVRKWQILTFPARIAVGAGACVVVVLLGVVSISALRGEMQPNGISEEQIQSIYIGTRRFDVHKIIGEPFDQKYNFSQQPVNGGRFGVKYVNYFEESYRIANSRGSIAVFIYSGNSTNPPLQRVVTKVERSQ